MFVGFEGTADRLVPFGGGRAIGPSGGREAVAAETTAADWAGANGCSAPPTVEALAGVHGDFAVDRLSWTQQARRPVILYRIAGGGHGWPIGPQYMPWVLVGRTARHLDAIGILLEFARAERRADERPVD